MGDFVHALYCEEFTPDGAIRNNVKLAAKEPFLLPTRAMYMLQYFRLSTVGTRVMKLSAETVYMYQLVTD